MPATNVTSVCWGGTNFDILYATSAQPGLTEDQLTQNPKNGSTFAISGLNTKGLPANKYVISKKCLQNIIN